MFKLLSKLVSFLVLLKMGSLSDEVTDTCHVFEVEDSEPEVVKESDGYQRSILALAS